MKVLVVTEYYPRAGDPVLGVWVHRQALAARDAGADVRVLVLHRPVPPAAAVKSLDLPRARRVMAQPAHATLDGLPVHYLRYLSPPRGLSYQSWGAWAALALKPAIARLRRQFGFDLVHAHYAVPSGDAVRRAAPAAPLVVSVHGHDVQGATAGGPNVRATLAQARLVLANSHGTARRCAAYGARRSRVIHLGADVPPTSRPLPALPRLLTVAHLAARKRHADVIAALPRLLGRHPQLRYEIVGEGPERQRLAALAHAHGVSASVEFRGALSPAQAAAAAQRASLFVLPSVDEAFGVAYVEAMAAGVPALGCAGEDGPQEIAAAGGGIGLVPARDPDALAREIDRLLADPPALIAMGAQARATVEREFTWERCGRQTVAAYAEAGHSAAARPGHTLASHRRPHPDRRL